MGVHYGVRPEGNGPYVPPIPPAPPGFLATGGSITTSGGFTIHTFNSDGTFQVTSGSNIVEVIAWGGGGGGGGGGDTGGTPGGVGGDGGYAASNVAVSTGSYSVVVGTGGTGGISATTNVLVGATGGTPGGGTGGGAFGGGAGLRAGTGGGGGGYSAFANTVLAAGGGGGGGGDNTAVIPAGIGGLGGNFTGSAGTSSGGATAGTGGTQSAGGTGGSSGGTSGSSLQGGTGGSGTGSTGRGGGGGGGGGRFGGGGGGGVVLADVGGGGGGGGSSFGDSYNYAAASRPVGVGTAGTGGAVTASGTNGGNGRVIIRYPAPPVPVIPPNVTFVEFVRNLSTNATQTTSINLGPEAAGRRIYILFLYSNNSSSSVNSFSINGVSGTIVWNQSSTGLFTAATAHAVGVVELPTGTTGSLITTFSGLFSGPSYAIYNVVDDTAPIGIFDAQTILSASAISTPSISCSVQQARFAFVMLSTGQSAETVNSVTGATFDGASADIRFVSHAENFGTGGTTSFTYNLASVADSGYRITAVSF